MSESKKSTQLKLTDLFNPTASKVSKIDHDEDPTYETSSSPIESLGHSDLPDRDTYYMEIQRWMAFCNHLKDPPTSLSESFILAGSDYYPNINTRFHLLLTMPVGSVPCERSFSALRRLKLWNRTTMTDHRLNGLALMHIHKDKEIDRNLVLDKFDAVEIE